MIIDCLAVFSPILSTTGYINFQAGRRILLTVAVFSPILSTTGYINFQAGRRILLTVEFFKNST